MNAKVLGIAAIATLTALVALAVLAPHASADSVSTTGATLPKPNDRQVAVWNGSYAFILGGVDRSTDIIRFTPETNNTTTLDVKLPHNTVEASAIWTGTYVFIFGGRGTDGERGSDAIVRFDPTANTTTTMKATLPYDAFGTAAVWDGSTYAYIFGGHSCNGCKYGDTLRDSVVRYDPVADKAVLMKATLPSKRVNLGAAWNGTAAIIVGGDTNGDGHSGGRGAGPVNDILAYDPVADSLTTLSMKLPFAELNAAVTWGNDFVWAFGGTGTSPLDSVVRIDPTRGVVTTMNATMPRTTVSAPAVWNATNAFIFGGDAGDGGSLIADVFRYNPEAGKPAGTNAAPEPGGQAQLKWDNPPANSYSHPLQVFRVWRAPYDGLQKYGVQAFVPIAQVAHDVLGYVDIPQLPGVYAYGVTAVNSDGESPIADSGNVIVIPGPVPLPMRPPPAPDTPSIPDHVKPLVPDVLLPNPVSDTCLPLPPTPMIRTGVSPVDGTIGGLVILVYPCMLEHVIPPSVHYLLPDV